MVYIISYIIIIMNNAASANVTSSKFKSLLFDPEPTSSAAEVHECAVLECMGLRAILVLFGNCSIVFVLS